jgi:hypothetical protein
MMRMLDAACERAGLRPVDLDLVVPHQANQRIINAVRQKYRLPEEKVYSNIRNLGNTSSSTIPLCLEQILAPVFGLGGAGASTGDKTRNRVAASGEYFASALLEKRPYFIGLTAFGGGFTFGGGIIEVL